MYIDCWGGKGLCRECHMSFGTWGEMPNGNIGKGILEITNNMQCPVCNEEKTCISQPYCNHSLCVKCFKECYYWEYNVKEPDFPYSEDIEFEYSEIYGEKDIKMFENKEKYDTLNLNEIEQYMYNYYQPNYKKYLIDELCSLNNKKYIIDKLKLDYLSSITSFELNKVELKKSNIHGYGVFAKQKILKNELITFYPGDFVEYYPNADGNKNNHITTIYYSERYVKQFGQNKHSDIFKKYRNNDYAFGINEHYAIIGCEYFKDDPNYLGHFINDGAKTNSTEKSNEIYIKITNKKRNCNFYSLKDLHVAIIAIKDIEIGDELFIRYGIGYWNSYNKK